MTRMGTVNGTVNSWPPRLRIFSTPSIVGDMPSPALWPPAAASLVVSSAISAGRSAELGRSVARVGGRDEVRPRLVG